MVFSFWDEYHEKQDKVGRTETTKAQFETLMLACKQGPVSGFPQYCNPNIILDTDYSRLLCYPTYKSVKKPALHIYPWRIMLQRLIILLMKGNLLVLYKGLRKLKFVLGNYYLNRSKYAQYLHTGWLWHLCQTAELYGQGLAGEGWCPVPGFEEQA